MFVLAVAGFLLLALCVTPASACERCGLFGNRCAFRQVQAVHVQQLVAAPVIYPQVNYFVGAPIRVEAIVQRSLQENPEYAEFQRFRAWKQALERKPTVGEPLNTPTETIPQTIPQTIPTSLLTTKCGTCHGGDAPKKGLLLDGTAKLNCEQVLKAMKAIQSGAMPPKNKLTPEEAGDVFHELLDLSER
jgi:mono/diheme cytochrome c family protein